MQYIFRRLRFLFVITRYLTLRKVSNLISISISYLLSVFKIEKHKDCLPFFLSVEATNFCNLHCPECPVGIRQITKSEMKSVDTELFKRLIDELKPTLTHLILYFQGEPLLNKHLHELIEYAHTARIFTSTSTNGQLLTKDNARLLVLSGLDKLIVSVDGTTQETYEKYRIGGKLIKAIEGIRHINYWKEELDSVTPMVEIQFLVLKSNEHQMKEMRKLSKDLKADRLAFKTAQLYNFENGSDRMTSFDRYSRYKRKKDETFKLKGNQPNRCFRLWSGGVVNAKGEVLPCCYDKMSEYSFGNIAYKGYSICRHSHKASDFRNKILQNRKQVEICRNCTG
ncbi:MAG: radical SAM/SPASM domain-containing protein [Paludibacter sp.]